MTSLTPSAVAARPHRGLVVALTALLAFSAIFSVSPHADAVAKKSLVGLFKLQAGGFTNGKVHGTYFRMIQPDGRTYLANTSAGAGHQTYTLLKPGTDGGLKTGAYQPNPTPAFAGNGDARSGRVTAPVKFYGIKFSTSTNHTDPQTHTTTKLPVIYATGSKLSGDLRAFSASWNRQYFNQGSPKPNGSLPGISRSVSGSYNSTTKAFTLTWRSKIVGGPFNNFTGEWHLAGKFVAAHGRVLAPARQAGFTPEAGLLAALLLSGLALRRRDLAAALS